MYEPTCTPNYTVHCQNIDYVMHTRHHMRHNYVVVRSPYVFQVHLLGRMARVRTPAGRL
jgi:hypothetical protein